MLSVGYEVCSVGIRQVCVGVVGVRQVQVGICSRCVERKRQSSCPQTAVCPRDFR